jgi:hypothetical protein
MIDGAGLGGGDGSAVTRRRTRRSCPGGPRSGGTARWEQRTGARRRHGGEQSGREAEPHGIGFDDNPRAAVDKDGR